MHNNILEKAIFNIKEQYKPFLSEYSKTIVHNIIIYSIFKAVADYTYYKAVSHIRKTIYNGEKLNGYSTLNNGLFFQHLINIFKNINGEIKVPDYKPNKDNIKNEAKFINNIAYIWYNLLNTNNKYVDYILPFLLSAFYIQNNNEIKLESTFNSLKELMKGEYNDNRSREINNFVNNNFNFKNINKKLKYKNINKPTCDNINNNYKKLFCYYALSGLINDSSKYNLTLSTFLFDSRTNLLGICIKRLLAKKIYPIIENEQEYLKISNKYSEKIKTIYNNIIQDQKLCDELLSDIANTDIFRESIQNTINDNISDNYVTLYNYFIATYKIYIIYKSAYTIEFNNFKNVNNNMIRNFERKIWTEEIDFYDQVMFNNLNNTQLNRHYRRMKHYGYIKFKRSSKSETLDAEC